MLESPINPDKRCIYRETFNDLFSVTKNNKSIDGTTYTLSNGAYDPNNSVSNYINTWYNVSLRKKFTIRIKGKPDTLSSFSVAQGDDASNRVSIGSYIDGNIYILISNGSNTYGYCAYNFSLINEMVFVYDGTQSTNATRAMIYINGVLQTLTFVGTIPSISPKLTSNSLRIGNAFVSSYISNKGVFNLVEIYNTTLTAVEVSLLYSNSLYKAPTNLPNLILDIRGETGFVDRTGNTTITNSGTIITNPRRDLYMPTTQYITLNTPILVNQPLTWCMWIRKLNIALGFNHMLISNGDNNNGYMIYNNTGPVIWFGGTNIKEFRMSGFRNTEWNMIVFKTTGNTIADTYNSECYINGIKLAIANTVPNPPSFTSINRIGYAGQALGAEINNIQCFAGLLTEKQIVQKFNSEKFLFGL